MCRGYPPNSLLSLFPQDEAEELRAEVLRLSQVLKEANAKEFAMDNATKQNSELLKLLMKSETEAAEVNHVVICVWL